MTFPSLRLLIPPPVVMVVVGLLMWALNYLSANTFLAQASFSIAFQIEIAWAVYMLAAMLMIASIAGFVLAQTTVNPLKPGQASHLLTTGVFRFSRNPIYLADLLLLGGWCVALGNLMNIPLLVVFVVYITRFQIIPEELALGELFGEAYSNYCARVRRWL